MKKAIIILAILLFTGTVYADSATVLKGSKVESWLAYENDGDIVLVGPNGETGYGQTDGDQTWIGVPGDLETDSTYIVIQHDD